MPLQPVSAGRNASPLPRFSSLAASLVVLTHLPFAQPAIAANDLVLQGLSEYGVKQKFGGASSPFNRNLGEIESAVPYEKFKEETRRSRPVQSAYNAGFVPLPSDAPAPSTSKPSTPPAAAAAPRASVKEQLAESKRLREAAETAEAQGNFQEAVTIYTELLDRCPDLYVLSLEIRFKRALLLYEAPASARAVLEELETLKFANQGDPDLLVVYASILYAEKPSLLPLCDQLYDNATSLDPAWNVFPVQPKKASKTAPSSPPVTAFDYLKTKKFPPKTAAAVERFLRLD